MKYGNKFYYEDEVNDEVVNFKIKEIKIDKSYKYINNNAFYTTISWITYRLFAMPIFWFYFTLIHPIKYVNRKLLKQNKNGCFIYANHTNQLADGVCPTFICFPKKPHIVCNSSNINIPFIGKFLKMWGALPLPNTIEATKNFNQAIEKIALNNNPIVIYPEAHLWPYYTKIRPFTNLSFRYPVKYNKPVYVFTTTYSKRKFFKSPKTTIYIDGPFYPDTNLQQKEAQQKLRDEVYNKMIERAKLNNYEYAIYEKKEQK